MIKTMVYLKNDYDSQYKEIEITEEEIRQMACNKVREMYFEGHWTHISAEDEISITATIN